MATATATATSIALEPPPVGDPSTVEAGWSPSDPVRRRRGRRRALRIAGAAVLGVALASDPSPLGLLAALFVLVVPFERLFPRHQQPFRRPGLGTDLTYGLASPLLGVAQLAVALVVGVLSLAWLPGLLVRPLVGALPGGARFVLGVLLFDLITYWSHRWSHEVPFLWRFHAVHHSAEQMDWVSGLRNHPVDGALLAPPFVFLVAAGFSPELTGALVVVQVVTGLFLHANVRWRWRPLQRLVITPEFHHWHHANEPDAHGTNYSVFLPVWDLVFGTWFMPAGRRPQRYGVDEPMPATFVAQLRHPLHGLHPLRALRHPSRLVTSLRRGARQVARSTRRRRRPASVMPSAG